MQENKLAIFEEKNKKRMVQRGLVFFDYRCCRSLG